MEHLLRPRKKSRAGAANELLHQWFHSICVLKLRLFCSVSRNAESCTKIWLKIQSVNLVRSGRTWLGQHARLLSQQLKSVIISVGEGKAAWSELFLCTISIQTHNVMSPRRTRLSGPGNLGVPSLPLHSPCTPPVVVRRPGVRHVTGSQQRQSGNTCLSDGQFFFLP